MRLYNVNIRNGAKNKHKVFLNEFLTFSEIRSLMTVVTLHVFISEIDGKINKTFIKITIYTCITMIRTSILD
jgi:hypothetical protein